ncbi:anti-sigma factor family protein [Thermomonospora amylolytica]|uniref:anti-sigma factor family protein n=1 Tax=Thermomonospora amylolytica TaxID=1411117 RepID=UPI000E6CBAC4|nr:zf-HC2 domain-containing protein [Thermomonospora amylolytica]
MTMTCDEVRLSLGVYVLGAIDPAERSAVDAHLTQCPACRDELAGLAGLPALLGRVAPDQLAALAEPPDDLLEPLLAAAAAERRRTPFRRLDRPGRWAPLVAAAAVVVLVLALFGGFLGDRFGGSPDRAARPPAPTSSGHSYPVPEEELSAADPRTGISATLLVRTKKSGTQAELRLEGVPLGSRCRLEAVDRHGRRDSMGSWEIAYRSYPHVGSSMFRRDHITAFEVVTEDGETLLRIPA